jgi:hypothetical protein
MKPPQTPAEITKVLFGPEEDLAQDLSSQITKVLVLRGRAGKRPRDEAFLLATIFALVAAKAKPMIDIMLKDLGSCGCSDPECIAQSKVIRDVLETVTSTGSKLIEVSSDPEKSFDEQINDVLNRAVEDAKKISGE